ncbi:MAG: sodium-dependent bicarbonate transport family permease [Hyphomicrobiaceae bacterium]
MGSFLDLALANLLSPAVLFFALGVSAALSRSDLAIPESIAKGMALYLMMSIGFKGGAAVAQYGIDATLLAAVAAGIVLSALTPLIAYAMLRTTSRLSAVDAAAVAAHYGSISIVTFLAMVQTLTNANMPYEGFMVAVAAAMETPAILVALYLARRPGNGARSAAEGAQAFDGALVREIALNGSIVMLIGAFVIGMITGERGLTSIAPFIVSPFQGVLCLFLLDMGVIAGRGLMEARRSLSPSVIAFAIYMPLIGAGLGAIASVLVGLSTGGAALLITLAASASYIAVPAAMRIALPDARPSIYLPLSLGLTFPFNLTIGIPIYLSVATLVS